jgi:hypothetical protein
VRIILQSLTVVGQGGEEEDEEEELDLPDGDRPQQVLSQIQDLVEESSGLGEGELADEVEEEERIANGEDIKTSTTRIACHDHAKGQCRHGFKGTACINIHQKICSKFLKHGRFEGGCMNTRCEMLHVQICRGSYLWGECFNKGCQQRHLQNTCRTRARKLSP